MATYAGFQRYEVPDIGGNVAKIMLAQQDAAAKRATAQQTADYRQAKLDAANKKEADKEGKDAEKDIQSFTTKRDDVLTTVPKTGFTSVDGFGSGLATLAKEESKAINDEFRQTKDYNKFNLKSQSLITGLKEYKTSYTTLTDANKQFIENGNGSPVVQSVIQDALEKFTPMPKGEVAPMGEYSEKGEWTPYIMTYRDGKADQKQPISTLNNLAAWTKFKPRDLESEMKTRVNDVGDITVEVKLPNGTTRTTLNPKGEQNFNESMGQWVKSVIKDPTTAAEAYIRYVGSLTKPAIPISKDASEYKKQLLVDKNGYDSIEKADFVEYEYKDGVPIFKLTDKQSEKLKNELEVQFKNKAPYKESFSTPSKTTNVFNLKANPERETKPTLTSLSKQIGTVKGYNAAVAGLKIAEGKGMINNKWKIIEDENGNATGDVEVYLKRGSVKGYPLWSKEPTVINAKDNPELYEIIFGYVSDASEVQRQQESTESKKVRK